jgi:DNA-binding XRE family transcriptional regulator
MVVRYRYEHELGVWLMRWSKLGGVVRQRRIARGMLTQADLAAAIGVSAQFIQLIERGQRRPSAYVCGRLAMALGLPTDEVLELAGWKTLPAEGSVLLSVPADMAPAVRRAVVRGWFDRATWPLYERVLSSLSPDFGEARSGPEQIEGAVEHKGGSRGQRPRKDDTDGEGDEFGQGDAMNRQPQPLPA